MSDASARSNRRAAIVIFLITFACYSFFFAGADWNSMSHFATIRSLAEHGNADISSFTSLTGDFTVTPRGTYSNKPPGIALIGTPFYFVLMKLERFRGIDIDAKSVWLGNLHAMAALLSALPAAILNVQLFFAMRREGARIRASMLLAGAFAFGSLSWPYSGTLMSHALCASLVFGAWYMLGGPTLTLKRVALAGALAGVASLCDLLIFPIALILAIYLVARKTSLRNWLAFCLGPIVSLLLLLLYNRVAHGAATQMGAFHPAKDFSAPGLFLGQFAWPQWVRLWWITFDPMRGLFLCCPIFLFCFAAVFVLRRPMRIRADRVVILLILGVYVAFYLTFFGWTGGWGVGLRYMIPVLPLLWMFALAPAQRFPKTCAGFAAWSIFTILSITSVKPMFPAPNSGPPVDSDPVSTCRTHFLFGELNQSDDGHNLASLAGVTGGRQLIPIYVLLVGYLGYALTRRDALAANSSATD